MDPRLSALVIDHVNVFKRPDSVMLWRGQETYRALIENYKRWMCSESYAPFIAMKLKRLGF